VSFISNLSVGKKLYAAFAAVSLVFALALAATVYYGGQSRTAWRTAQGWEKAVKGSQMQIESAQQQLGAQALYVATFEPKYKAEWEAGVALGDRGTKIVQGLGDPVIAQISQSAANADHHHDATVHSLLFPAVARGDHKAALAALEKADRYVRIPLAALEKIGARIDALREHDVKRAESLQARAQTVGLVVAITAILLAALFAIVIARAITRPLTRVRDAAELAASGDLRVELTATSNDEIGALATAFQTMITSVRGIIEKVTQTAGVLAGASQQMASTSQEAGRAVGEIAHAVGDVASGAERQVRMVDGARETTEQMVQAARTSAENANETATAAGEAQTVSEAGMSAVERATTAMRSVNESSVAVTSAMRALGAKSEEIGGIVETITGIAGQTNLLALNAAIEAARAGEQGRGFAVVAEEVRKLAEESQSAAASIADLVNEIQAETQATIQVVEEGAQRAEDGVGVVNEARTAFERIGGSVADVSGRIGDITASVDQILADARRMHENIAEVAAVAEESSASTQQVSASAEQTSASTQQIAASAEELARTAEELERLVGQLTIAA
jgi:methyl-accepting chemotaxis protein